MSTTKGQVENRVPVGKTPVTKYTAWKDHRDALRREAEARRTTVN
jgi:hypothetical protein